MRTIESLGGEEWIVKEYVTKEFDDPFSEHNSTIAVKYEHVGVWHGHMLFIPRDCPLTDEVVMVCEFNLRRAIRNNIYFLEHGETLDDW